KELLQVRESAGMSIAFKTSSRTIAVKCEFGDVEWPQNSTGIAAHGFDLYIKKDGAWRWAGSGARRRRSTRRSTSPPAWTAPNTSACSICHCLPR
ncbi:MAG: hypothetical protein KIG90_01735, partial [Muribaculaceae bacterium]|nr:hypothetical protein [Muribaculaceae bacterium]